MTPQSPQSALALLDMLRRKRAMASPTASGGMQIAPMAPVNTGLQMDPLAGGNGGPLGRVPLGRQSLAPMEPAPPPAPMMGGLAPWDGDNNPGRPDFFGSVGAPPVPRGFDPAPQRDYSQEAGPFGRASLRGALLGLLFGGGRGALAAGVGAGRGYMQGADAGHRGRMDSWERDAQVRRWEDANKLQDWGNRFRLASAQEQARAHADSLAAQTDAKEADRQLRADIAAQTDATRRFGIKAVDARQRDAMHEKGPLFEAQAQLMKKRAAYLEPSLNLQKRKVDIAARQGDKRNAIGMKNAQTSARRVDIAGQQLELNRAKYKDTQQKAGVKSARTNELDRILAARPVANRNRTYGTIDPPTEQATASWFNRFETFRRATQKEYAARGLRLEMSPITMEVNLVPIQPRDVKSGQWRGFGNPSATAPKSKQAPRPTPKPTPRPVTRLPRKTSVRYGGFDYDVSVE